MFLKTNNQKSVQFKFVRSILKKQSYRSTISCDLIHLLSSLTFYPASTDNDTFAIKPHLLSGQFTINPLLQSTIFLSIIICYHTFDFLSIFISTIFFLLKICKKIKKNSQKSWVFDTNSDFLIPISLQPNVVDLRYFKLWILLHQIILVWNIKSIQHQVP